ncbi:MAG: cysteine synthase A, partial [Clostridia bacterium]|nr:cysteine synthase A [Clostridia bacterium]
EKCNPAGSVKDRVALYMIRDAEKKGLINKDTKIIEPTSGNTGIGIACFATIKGYKTILVMPENMSQERIKLLKAYGAEVILTKAELGMQGSIEKANELAKQNPNSFIPSQFDNVSNIEAHKMTTGPEIWKDTNGNVDFFVAGVGTGGTITGIGEYLKEHKDSVKIIAVEPKDSPLLSEGKSGTHGIQGIGANFIPSILNQKIYDEVLTITTEEAYTAVKELVKTEGLLVGISSGASLSAATKLAQLKENEGKTFVVLLPDSGERYLSTPLFS